MLWSVSGPLGLAGLVHVELNILVKFGLNLSLLQNQIPALYMGQAFISNLHYFHASTTAIAVEGDIRFSCCPSGHPILQNTISQEHF